MTSPRDHVTSPRDGGYRSSPTAQISTTATVVYSNSKLSMGSSGYPHGRMLLRKVSLELSRVIAVGQFHHLLHFASDGGYTAADIEARDAHWCSHWGQGAELARHRDTAEDLEQDAHDRGHLVVEIASLIEDSGILDWNTNRAAATALNAVCHHELANVGNVIKIFSVGVLLVHRRIELLCRDDVVVVAAVSAAIAT